MKLKCLWCGEETDFGKYVDDFKTIDGDDLELTWACNDCGTPHVAQYTLVDVRILDDKEC